MPFIKYPFPIHDQNEPSAKGPGMSDREAFARIRPRTAKDKKVAFWAIVIVVIGVPIGIAIRLAFPQFFHLDTKSSHDLHITTAPAAYH